MPRKHRNAGRYYVTADDQNRMFESAAAAASLAQTFASRSGADKSFYVKEVGTLGAIYVITRHGRDIFTDRVRS